MTTRSREFARTNHTREKFAEEYKKIVLEIMEKAAQTLDPPVI
jgi:hypothetical protein